MLKRTMLASPMFTLSVYLLLLVTKGSQSNNGAIPFNTTQAVQLGKDVVISISLGTSGNYTNQNLLCFKNGTFNFYVDNTTFVFPLLNVTEDGNYTLCVEKKYKEKVSPVSDAVVMFLSTYCVPIASAALALIVIIVAACLVRSRSKAFKKEIRELKNINAAQATTLQYLSKLTVQRNDCDFLSLIKQPKPSSEQDNKESVHQIPSMPSYPPPVPPNNKELLRSSSPNNINQDSIVVDQGPCYEDCMPIDRPPFPLPSEIREQPFYDNVAPDPEQSTTRNFMSSIKSLVSRNAKKHQQHPRQNVQLSNRQSPVFGVVTQQQFKSGFDNPTFHS